MASTIVQRIIGGSQENAIQLNNSNFARPITLPAGWSKIRLGLRWHTTSTGANLTSFPNIYAGFGSGTTNLIGDATTDNWIGLFINVASWTFSAGPIYTITQGIVATRVGSTLSLGAAIFGGGQTMKMGAGAGTAAADRTVLYFDLTKGSPNYTANTFYHNGANPTTDDVSSATFLSQMNINTPVISGHALFSTPANIAFSEATFPLNTIQCYWNRSDALFEICDLAVALLA